MTPKKTLKKWFSNLMKPAQEHFAAWIDSFWHKSEQIPMSSIEGLSRAIENTASAGQLLNHINDTNAHRTLFDKKVDKEEGKGLSSNDFTNDHKQKLEGLQPTDVSSLLPKGGYDGTGQQLKEAIDGLQTKMQQVETTLSVDDTSLDTLQEIVSQVKDNKDLATIINGKMDKDEFFEKLKQLVRFFENSQISISNPLGRMDISSKYLYIRSSEELLQILGAKGVDIVSKANITLETNEGIYIRGNFGQNIVKYLDVYVQDVNFRGDDSMNVNISGYKTISLIAQDSISFNAQTVRVNGNSLTTLFEDFQNLFNKVGDLESRISLLENRPAGYP